MKIAIGLIGIVWLLSGCVQYSHSPPTSYSKEFVQALIHGAKAKLSLAVRDEEGRPLPGASARIFFEMGGGGKSVRAEEQDNGIYTAERRCTGYSDFGVDKKGYYRSTGEHMFQSQDPERLIKGRWLPWNPTETVILRKIKNPIPLCAILAKGRFRTGDTAMFDCEKGEFLPPYGNGEIPDFGMTLTVDVIPGTNETQKLILTSLDPAGGFRIEKVFTYSAFKSEYLAPTGGYATNLVATARFTQNGYSIKDICQGNEYLIFKSRIVRDAAGKIVKANYGKICGRIDYGREDDEMKWVAVEFNCYFNPTPNDRNLEFDSKTNLIRGSPGREIQMPFE